MDLYRIGPEKFLEIYTGKGASYQDGARWNEPGDPVIYFGTSPSVAMLEMGNYISSPRQLPSSYRLARYQLPDEFVDVIDPVSLPMNWSDFPHPNATRAYGSQWLRQKKNVALLVPSSAVPGGLENIAIYNPQHPEANQLTFIQIYDKIYDDRLFRK